MFEILSEKISKVLYKLGSKGKLSQKDIDEALRQIQLALLEADVNFKVVKMLLANVRRHALTTEVLQSLTPAQQITKIVNKELVTVLGKEPSRLIAASNIPSIAMLIGLQGSGKTTTAAKLALNLKQSGQRPLLVAADTHRPAAIQQLATLGKQLDIPVYNEDAKLTPINICTSALQEAKKIAATWLIIDTQGRLHIDETMMRELALIKCELRPSEILLVVDATTGQDAVRIAEEFNNRIGLTGLILTKLDGDARGGAALSIRFISQVPIKFIGTGEKINPLEPFFPDRMASRILGMGDVLSLIEKAERTFDKRRVKELEKKIHTASFDLEDLLWQLRETKKMGPLTQLAEMLPGTSKLATHLNTTQAEKQLRKTEAIILSMTPEERHHPTLIGGSRRRRIARGSGTTPQEINHILNQLSQIKRLARATTQGKLPRNLTGTVKKLNL